MNATTWIGRALLVVAMITGYAGYSTHPDSLHPDQQATPKSIDGRYVLSADFHVHVFPGDDSNLSPWDILLEARRYKLDVIAITPHNYTWTGKLGQWIAQHVGGPLVIAGEEIHAPTYHLLAIGIHQTIDWRLSAASAIREIHRQGGVAIAAHPFVELWPAFDELAMQQLDGAEVVHPGMLLNPKAQLEFRQFYERHAMAAIGDSDTHGLGPIGACRTFVFTRDISEQGVLDAIRSRQTVTYDRGRYYGDPDLIQQLIQLVKDSKIALPPDPMQQDDHWLINLSRVAGGLGLLIAILLGPRFFGMHTIRYS